MVTNGAGQADAGGYAPTYSPLGGYATLLGAWTALYGAALTLGVRKGVLPERISPGDVVLLGVATHKLTRVLTKDWVTAPLRAPFVRYEESVGGGEVKESARGRGLRRAIGDLVTCPWCSGPWVAGALVAGLLGSPRVTRLVAGTFSVVAVSDFLHHAYGAVKRASD